MGAGGIGVEILVDLSGEGEVGGYDAEVELYVGPDGGDGVGPWGLLGVVWSKGRWEKGGRTGEVVCHEAQRRGTRDSKASGPKTCQWQSKNRPGLHSQEAQAHQPTDHDLRLERNADPPNDDEWEQRAEEVRQDGVSCGCQRGRIPLITHETTRLTDGEVD